MSLFKSLSAAAAVAMTASAASAAITPSWRVNPINANAIAANSALANAVSLSLMVEGTGGSLFNVAGLKLSQDMFGGAPFTVFNDASFGSDGPPSTALFPVFPAVEYDTYVSTSARTNASIPGAYDIPGAAILGPNSVNVAWGATPNTAINGQAEVARVTLIPGAGTVFAPGATPVSGGEVRDNLSPNTAIPLPPLPIAVPEPATLGLAAIGLGLASLRRR